MQSVGTAVPAVKMCLTERNRMPLPSSAAMEAPDVTGPMVLFLACVFISANCASNGILTDHTLRNGPPACAHTHPSPCLNHFFFLPPPSLLFSV
jgi:hypothetical protein